MAVVHVYDPEKLYQNKTICGLSIKTAVVGPKLAHQASCKKCIAKLS